MSSPGSIEPEGVFDGLSGTAIALGAFLDIGATTLLGVALTAWLAPGAFDPDPATADAAVRALYERPGFALVELAIGMSCTVLGAFVAARRAGRLHVRHGGWVAVAGTALGALLILSVPSEPSTAEIPFWVEALGWVLILPAGVAGGALARALHREERPWK